MTTVTVDEYDTVRESGASTREADRILQSLTDADEALCVFRAEPWVWEDNDLEALSHHETLVRGVPIAETEKAWLVTQQDHDDPDDISAEDEQTAWVAKSVTTRYRQADEGVDKTSSPQGFLGDFE